MILVTGATGFVGRALCDALANRGRSVTKAVRRLVAGEAQDSVVTVGDIGSQTDWHAALNGVEVVVHLAARVHVMNEHESGSAGLYQEANVAGTEVLARAAAAAGVRRFIFLSTVKVNGESTSIEPFTENDAVNPQDSYAASKYEAEQLLRRISSETGMEIVILRPPVIYGPEVKANFLRMMQWVDTGFPLPLAAVHNQRSMLYLGNLVDALVTCIDHVAAAGNTFLLSDGEDVSTPGLIQRIAKAMGRPDRLWPCPVPLLRIMGGVVGKSEEIDRLLASLQIDSSKIRSQLGWTPPFSLAQGIDETVKWFVVGKQGDAVRRGQP